MAHNDNTTTGFGDRKTASSVNQDIVKKYIELFDRLPIGIYRTTPDGKIVTANPAFLNLLGYNNMEDLEEIDANKTHKSPDARKLFMQEIEDKGQIYAKESILVTRDGKDVTVEEYAKVYKKADGEVLFYEGIVIDMMQKKRDQERIAFLSRFKELILNLTSSFINIRLSDIDGQIDFSLHKIGKFIGADRSYVFLFHDKMKFMSNTHESVAEGISSVIDELQELVTDDFPWWMDKLKKNKAIIIPDIRDLSPEAMNEKKIFLRQEICSLYAVPMFFDYQLIGFLGFDMVNEKRLIADDVLELLEITAGLFANILNYQKTETEKIENRKELVQLIDDKTLELEGVNKHLRMIAESSNDVIWTMDLNLKTTYMSPSVFKQLGFKPEEYMAMPLEKRLPPESVKMVQKIFSRELDLIKNEEKSLSEHSVIFEMLHLTKDGKQVWGEVSFSFLFDDKGKPTGIHGITRDVHERKLAEILLWESNQRFKDLVENTSDWIWEVDTKGIYTYSSPMSKTIIGYEPDEVLGKSFSDFLDPECKENSVKYFENIVQSQQVFRNHENVAQHKNGKRVWLETSGVPIFNINGKFIGYRGIDRDITEKKNIETTLRHSQSKLSQHLKNTPLGYIEWDENFEVIEWNPAAKSIFGYSKAQAMIGDMMENLIPPEDRKEIMEYFQKVISSGNAVRKTYHCITSDGQRIRCEWYNTPLFDESKNIAGIASLIRLIDCA